MSRQSQRKNVLSAIIVATIIIILAVLGFVFWDNFTQSKSGLKTIDTRTEIEQKDTDYITLSDWGVRMQLPENLSLDNVKYSKNSVAEAPEYYSLTTSKIFDQGGECATGYPFGDIVSLQRSPKDQYVKENAEEFGGEINEGIAINDYVYYYSTSIKSTTPTPACAVTELAKSERNLLIEMTKSLTAASQ